MPSKAKYQMIHLNVIYTVIAVGPLFVRLDNFGGLGHFAKASIGARCSPVRVLKCSY